MLPSKFLSLGFERGAAARRSVGPTPRNYYLHVPTLPRYPLFAGIGNRNSLQVTVAARPQPSEAVITPDAFAYWRREIAKVDRCDSCSFAARNKRLSNQHNSLILACL